MLLGSYAVVDRGARGDVENVGHAVSFLGYVLFSLVFERSAL